MRTRFAPSPTGPLHLGHAFAAWQAWDLAHQLGGDVLLRIEDIDRQRSKPQWEAQIYDDLGWLGLTWPQPVMRQSDRLGAYARALDQLWAQGLLFPCSCKRRDIQEAANAPQEGVAPLYGPDGLVYPGTCRTKPRGGPRPEGALRLDMAAAVARTGAVTFEEIGHGPDGETGQITVTPKMLIETVGDVVLSRRDFLGSYHLSVVLDDAAQGITHVTRGADLFSATAIHVLLQRVLDLPTPIYLHHRLIRDAQGRRLAKRDDARAIAAYRAEGMTPQALQALF